MHITRVSLPVLDPGRAAAFYGEVLELPTDLDQQGAAVQIGSSVLELRPSSVPVGSHHLAFTIPTGSFAQARSWLSARLPLLDRDGVDEFEGPPSWNSRSLYFGGPERSVLELIERRDLAGAPATTFTSSTIVNLSEVGVAVSDVVRTVKDLSSAGLQSYGDAASPGFAAVGDAHGLLILVSPGRPWLPTADRHAASVRTVIEAGDGVPGRYGLGETSTLTVG